MATKNPFPTRRQIGIDYPVQDARLPSSTPAFSNSPRPAPLTPCGRSLNFLNFVNPALQFSTGNVGGVESFSLFGQQGDSRWR